MKTKYKIILGSKSPRRKELLKELGFDFTIKTKDTDESYPSDFAESKVAEFIAQKKANALINEIKEDELLICSDTVVVINNEILGKPQDYNEAFSMLSKLSGNSHKVITGVVLANPLKKHSFSVTTEVTFKELSKDEIDFYINEYKPFDKAGAYGIQEWIGFIGVTELKGSYFNVVGLPTAEVYREIIKF